MRRTARIWLLFRIVEKRNSSLNLVYVAEEIAGLKGISYEEVVRQTTENAKKIISFQKVEKEVCR